MALLAADHPENPAVVLALTPKPGRYGQIRPNTTILKTEARSFERLLSPGRRANWQDIKILAAAQVNSIVRLSLHEYAITILAPEKRGKLWKRFQLCSLRAFRILTAQMILVEQWHIVWSSFLP